MDEDEEKKENIPYLPPPQQGIISESDLLDVYENQYNDLFSKILKISEEKFFALLQEQVLLNLRIINKLSDLSLMSFFQEIINERYKLDKEKVIKGFEIIKELDKNEITYLDHLNCYIHCYHNLEPKHKCGNKLIIYEKNIYCLNCNKVYTENQIKLYCTNCKESFYSKIKDINNDIENNDLNEDSEDDSEEDKKYLYPAAFAEYHCKNIKVIEKEEKIKCLECGGNLYFNLSTQKENFLICTKCKLIFDSKQIKFKCNFCQKKILAKVKLYNDFSPKKNLILFLIHTLYKENKAFPKNNKCECDYDKLNKKEFYHLDDKGVLLFGKNNSSEQKIICSQCFNIWDIDKYKWKCPLCNVQFYDEIKKEENIINNKDINDAIDDFMNEEEENKDDNNLDNINNIRNENFEDIEDIEKYEEEDVIKMDDKEEIKIIDYNNKNNENNKDNINIINNKEDNIKIYEYKKEENINIDNNINERKNTNENMSKSISNPSTNKNYNVIENNRTIIIDLPQSNNNKVEEKNRNKININVNKYYINKTKSNENLNKKEDNKVYKNLSTKVVLDTKNENKNDGKYSSNKNNNNNNKLIKKLDYINNREKYKSNLYINNRPNHQIVNINETSSSKNVLKRNNTTIEQNQNNGKEKEKENRDKNKIDINEKDDGNQININKDIINKKKEKEFRNIQKYFDDFNEEYIKELEIQEEKKKNRIKKEKDKEKHLILNKENNLKIEINEENKIDNNYRHNRKNNIHEIKYISNKKNQIYTDNNLIQKNDQNNEHKNSKEKNLKSNLSSNKLNISQNKNIININKENNNNFNNIKHEIIYKNKEKEKEKEINSNTKNNKTNNLNEIKNAIEPQKNINFNPVNPSHAYQNMTINSNNFKNIGILGQGSYGKIYLVEDINTKEQYAMKKIILGDQLELKDNQDEYNMIMQISSTYPDLNIIHVYGTETKNFDEYNFVFYVLMEVANCDWEKELLNRAKENAYYTEEEIIYILQSLVDTFSYLQQIGICHRDIKPQNILCFGEKGYKISDFGEAKFRKKWRLVQNPEGYTAKQTVRGTELYMSPILYHALKTSPSKGAIHNVFKSDVFSLGMCFLLASCLDYKCLYDMRKVKNMNDIKKIVDKYVNKKYSENFVNILLIMLNLNEKDRPDFIELGNMV